ncbi:MAG: HAD-IA family hydrolase [Pseudomonadota bacterium]
MKPTVVFDLDGTLADTSGDLIAAANSCFRGLDLGDVLHPVHDAATALRGGRSMLRLGLSRVGRYGDEDEVARQYPVLLGHYAAAIDTHTTLYPGAMEAVDRLKSRGYAVSICTNKPESLARRLMGNLGVLDAFGALVGADTLATCKPDPAPYFAAVERAGGNPRRSLLIGDSETDHATARAAGVASVLVTFAPTDTDLSTLDPEATIDHFDALDDVVSRLLV